MRRAWHDLVLGVALGGLAARGAVAQQPLFDHARHAKLFPSCITCHAGVVTAGASIWPDSVSCAACHDGQMMKQVAWHLPFEGGRYNLRFEHATHAARPGAPQDCVACHSPEGAGWMTAVGPPRVERCFECHGVLAAHYAAPDTACVTCHLPLAEAKRLTTADVASFAAPPSHRDPGFAGAGGHGAAARAAMPVAASCATCHARDFCLQCHVDAPEQRAIQGLAPDPRSRAIVATLTAPKSHADPAFLTTHGAVAGATPERCSTCHTRESCMTCHLGRPRVVAKLYPAGSGRATGAVVTRHPPPSHGDRFASSHAGVARTATATCSACHVRADCLECHRPDAGRASGYHPRGFLARHPAAAYARETSCSDCHNTREFCTTCHARAGLRASGTLRNGYHGASQFFIAGHGGAARQNLESCVSCHAERDCLTCHSANGGRHYNPHGPGFDAARLIKKNPQMCTACHGTNIPTQ